MISVLIADDQHLVRLGLRTLITNEDDLTCVGEPADGLATVAMAVRTRPDIVLMDIRMPASTDSKPPAGSLPIPAWRRLAGHASIAWSPAERLARRPTTRTAPRRGGRIKKERSTPARRLRE